MISRSGSTGGAPTVVMDHNLYYFPDGKSALSGSFDAMGFESFDQYLKLSGNDSGSIFADPKFVDANSADFHLRRDSPALGKGEYLEPGLVGSQDLDGHPRMHDRKLDLGCYQAPPS